MMLAPARRIAVSVSMITLSRSSQPFAAAAYQVSGEYAMAEAATGTGATAAARAMTSR